MKRKIICVFIFVTIIFSAFANSISSYVFSEQAFDNQVNQLLEKDNYLNNKIIIKYKNGVKKNNKVLPFSINSNYIEENSPKLDVYELKKKSGEDINKQEMADLLKTYLKDPNIEYAEPVYIAKPSSWTTTATRATPNDYDAVNKHKYLEIGKAPEMWKNLGCNTNLSGSPCANTSNVVVAVLDSGLGYGNGYQYKPGMSKMEVTLSNTSVNTATNVTIKLWPKYSISNATSFYVVWPVQFTGGGSLTASDVEITKAGDTHFSSGTARSFIYRAFYIDLNTTGGNLDTVNPIVINIKNLKIINPATARQYVYEMYSDYNGSFGTALANVGGANITANANKATFGNAPEVNQSNLWTNPIEAYGDKNSDGWPGVANVDDDSDGLVDEDIYSNDKSSYLYVSNTTTYDDDENGYPDDVNGANVASYMLCFYQYYCQNEDQSFMGRAYDDMGHGTSVAGIIAATYDNGATSQALGIAPNVKLMPVKVFYYDKDYFSYITDTETLAKAIIYAVDNGANVINMSLGTTSDSLILKNAVNYADLKGVSVVAAAGNDGNAGTQAERMVTYPATYPSVISVGATNLVAYPNTNRAYYSSYGSNTNANAIMIDVVAAVGDGGYGTDGVYTETLDCSANIYKSFNISVDDDPCGAKDYSTSNFNNFKYEYQFGTSFAAPQIAAAVAYIKALYPNTTTDEVKRIIRLSTVDIGAVGIDAQTGYGLFQFDKLNTVFSDRTLSKKYYFTWNDTSAAGRDAWTLVGNPSTTQSANVTIKIAGSTMGTYSILPGEKITPYYSNIINGPVEITSDIDVYATQRVLFNGSFNEFAGISESSLTNKYYFTWYDTSGPGKDAWILVGNPSLSQTANVTIKIAGITRGTYGIPAGGRITPEYSGILDGPVEVSSDINVYTTQRVLYNGSFNEYAGIPADSLTNKYYFTWNDTSAIGRDAWTLVGNPSLSQTANVTINIAGNTMGTYAIAPGGKITPYYSNLIDGPVEVSSDINVYTTQRVLYNGSFNEFAGIRANNLKDKYYFTWNDTSAAGRDAWTLVGNSSYTLTANVNIRIAGILMGTYSIPPGGKITPYYSNVINGPVIVTSDINTIYTTQRVLFYGSFNEMDGI
ncbi:MAG: S8 family serine peptidase [bacterium]